MRARPSMTPDERLRHHGWTETASGCWVWSASTNADGYGHLWINGKVQLAHRVAYETWVGPIPDGLKVTHSCDNPPCVNPAHLRVGTDADNAAERRARDRGNRPKGERNPNAKLTWVQVRAIREAYAAGGVSQSALARQYGVNHGAVNAIVRGKKWVE